VSNGLGYAVVVRTNLEYDGGDIAMPNWRYRIGFDTHKDAHAFAMRFEALMEAFSREPERVFRAAGVEAKP